MKRSKWRVVEIDAFAARVQARGGRLVRHVFLRRGRIYWQKSRETLLREARKQLRSEIDAGSSPVARSDLAGKWE